MFAAIIYLLAVLCLTLPSPWRVTLGRVHMLFAAYQALLTAALVITRRDI